MRVLKPITDFQALRLEPQVCDKSNPTPHAADQFRKIALPTMDGIYFERVNDIISLEAKGNYTYLYFTRGRQLLISKTLREMEAMLATNTQFVRIHRSFTINLNYLLKYIKGKGGFVEMEGGTHFNVSIGKKQAFLDALEKYFGCKM